MWNALDGFVNRVERALERCGREVPAAPGCRDRGRAQPHLEARARSPR